MSRLFCARYLLPISGPPIEQGAMLVDGGRIVTLGTRDVLMTDHPDAALVECGDSVILPPMVNAHTHLELSGYPSWCGAWQDKPEPGDFVEWIRHLIRVKLDLPRESYAAAIRDGIKASLKAGTGAVGDILSTHDARAAYRGSPLLGRLYFELLGQNPAVTSQKLEALEQAFAAAPFGKLAAGLSPHSPYSLSRAVLKVILDYARKRSWPATMHFAESIDEVEFLKSSGGAIAERLYPYVGWRALVPPATGKRPLAYLLEFGPLPEPMLLVHGVQVTAEEVGQIRETGASVVFCPRSNAQLGAGKAPVAAYHAAGVPLALGTDSLASAPSLSLWDELAFAWRWFAGELTADTWLEVATTGGAAALGQSEHLGRLEPGREANFQVVTPPGTPSIDKLTELLCAEGERVLVKALYLGGENVLSSY